MLLDSLKKYSDKSYDLNCAEKMIYSANEEYNMGLSKQTLKTMAGFGGGMGVESVCGAISGSVAVISLLFTNINGHESKQVCDLCKEFYEKFEQKLGTANCSELKAKYKKDDEGCAYILETATEILDEIIKREKNL